MRSRPVSRVLSWTVIHLGQPSPVCSSSLPGNLADHTLRTCRMLPYLALLRVGFSVPRPVTSRAVRSYRTFSPLPARTLRRFVFCGTFHGLAPSRRYLAPCPMEPGLSSVLPQRLPGRLRAPPYSARGSATSNRYVFSNSNARVKAMPSAVQAPEHRPRSWVAPKWPLPV